MRGLLQRLAATAPAEWVVSALEAAEGRGRHLCAVLTYHRVLDPETDPAAYPGLCVHPRDLERQVSAVARRYPILALADLLAARDGGARLPRRSVLLTFDDAYADFDTNAWPILRRLSLPATLFVPTDFPDRNDRWFWWDRLHELVTLAAPRRILASPIGPLPVATPEQRRLAFRSLRDHAKRAGHDRTMSMLDVLSEALSAPPPRNQTLGWDALRRIAAEGVTLAPHGRSHRLLTELSGAELHDELSQSRTEMEARIGAAPPAIAYPSGAYDARVLRAAEAAGYRLGFTTRRGVNDPRRPNWLALRRINVGRQAAPTLVRAQVAVGGLGPWRE